MRDFGFFDFFHDGFSFLVLGFYHFDFNIPEFLRHPGNSTRDIIDHEEICCPMMEFYGEILDIHWLSFGILQYLTTSKNPIGCNSSCLSIFWISSADRIFGMLIVPIRNIWIINCRYMGQIFLATISKYNIK